MLNKIRLGFCVTASFCTFDIAINLMEKLADTYDIIPIMSENSTKFDTKFGKAQDHIDKIKQITGRDIINSIVQAEPIGPQNLTDIMLVAPCTGNTIAKLANSITDTTATMAVKSHLRNSRPVVIAVSTNDALAGSAKNIGTLQNYKNYYFVPYAQDNYKLKPTSIVADFSMTELAIKNALDGIQIQPLVLQK